MMGIHFLRKVKLFSPATHSYVFNKRKDLEGKPYGPLGTTAPPPSPPRN